ncbi:MAG: 4Fe-4S binding protein [Deltaproteobacteria bacterium]|nr:4Fe-4S binding protein [Deltaproteobacteria bacterium]
MIQKIKKETILMGNEAIALGIIENGCSVACSYPGTPASEILTSIARYRAAADLKMHIEWSVNEKAAFEVALANSYAGCRSAVAMKQVGLNVALDPLMSSAYTGVMGGFLLVSADDPGPHSSQTEQDSRFVAMLAKIPVLDPSSPREAHDMISAAYALSEKYSVPVMLRPTTRVCHARQNIAPGKPLTMKRKAVFLKDPERWAATPKFRYKLHADLNKKLCLIAAEKELQPSFHADSKITSKNCIVSSGVAYSYILDFLTDYKLLDKVALCKVPMPFPLPDSFLKSITTQFKKILVIEETYPVMELQIHDRRNVTGRLSGHVPAEGEITPDSINHVIRTFFNMPPPSLKPAKAGGQRPSLCPGCPHRATYFAIKKALPQAIYPGDIGCYTLGINLGAVDTCLCMGASINQAAGFYHSLKASASKHMSIVATIGDSTFLHSGITALINAVYNGARFILVILDNSTTAMTGNQPTAATGVRADCTSTTGIHFEKLIEGCGVTYIKNIDSYDVQQIIAAVKDADVYTRKQDGGIAVIISKHPCLVGSKPEQIFSVSVTDDCTGCQYCINNFECPALVLENGKVHINTALCNGCGVCAHVCPVHAIKVEEKIA